MACPCEDCHEQLRCSQIATEHTRNRLVSLTKEHQVICNKHARILLLQRNLCLLRDECEKKRRWLAKVKEEVELLKRANERKEERLRRARGRDFARKIQSAQKEYSRKQVLAHSAEDELVTIRRLLVRRTVEWVFPISIEQSVNGNLDVSIEGRGSEEEEEEDWVLSGVSTPCITPLAHICHGFLPANGDMAGYIDMVKKKKKETHQLQDCHNDAIPCQHSHLHTSVPAAMTCVVHCVALVSSLLDRPLPYPIYLPLALCEYGKTERRPRAILTSLTKLNDNVMYLCFTQLVPIERLTVGHVLDNLLSLVHHENLGRCGPYTCHSHLLQHTSSAPRSPQESSTVHDWDNTPPLLHSADEDGLLQKSLSFSTDEEELVGDCDESSIEEWEEVEDINRVPYLGLGDRLEYGQVYGDYSGGRGHQAQWREEESTVQSSSAGLLEALGSLLGSGFKN